MFLILQGGKRKGNKKIKFLDNKDSNGKIKCMVQMRCKYEEI